MTPLHRERYNLLIERDMMQDWDKERQALFYVLSGNEDLFKKVDYLYDFEKRAIKLDYPIRVDFSSSSQKLIRLAFNLFNGVTYENDGVINLVTGLDEKNLDLAMEAILIRIDRHEMFS